MLQYVDVPVHYVGRQTENLLHGSEIIFPPFNAFCTLGNLILSGFAYYHPESPGSAKLRKLAIAGGLHIATTVYTLSIMAPYNKRLVALSRQLNQGVEKGEEKTEGQTRAADSFRDVQMTWKKMNYVRGAIMLAAGLANAVALSS